MTEIQWLVDLMLNHKLPEPVKQKFIARIGEVEASLARTQPTQAMLNQALQPIIRPSPMAQSPSTQKILDGMAQENSIQSTPMPLNLGTVNTPLIRAPTPPPAKIDKETGRPTVATGKGSFGPRKF